MIYNVGMNCLVSGCPNKLKCRGYCSTHYKQLLKHGMIVIIKPAHHGQSKSREYRSWEQMKQRCLNKNNHAYYRYGGRGIKVCNRWLNNFTNFLEDMGRRPKATSIDRINPNGNYEPLNCRWATANEQGATRRNNNPYVGLYYEQKKHSWKATLTYNGEKVLNKRFKKFEDALAARKEAEKMYISG